MKRSFIVFLMLFVCSNIFASSIYFPSMPSLSPDGKTIFFSYDGDIFKVSSEGGIADRLISMDGEESNPIVSPDGKYLVFSSNATGWVNLYLVGIEGGDVKQLTFHDGVNRPVSWSADSKTVYFESNRFNNMTTYMVNIDGSTPKRLFDNYFNTVVNLTQNPRTGVYYFNESTESYRFQTRKGYRGDHNPDIKMWSPKDSVYKELTTYRGKDIWPMVGSDGLLYYVSDSLNGQANIVSYETKECLTKFDKSIQYPSISFNGQKIVFIKGYQIAILDVKSKEVNYPKISVLDNRIVHERSFTTPSVNTFSVSPDNKKLAYSSRGLIFITDIKGEVYKTITTPHTERVSDIFWIKDNRQIIYTRTDKGVLSLFSQRVDKDSQELVLYRPSRSMRSLAQSQDGSKLAFIEGDNLLMIYDIEKSRVDTLTDIHEFWSFQDFKISFSLDGRFITYSAINLFERDVYIYDLNNRKVLPITNNATFDNDPIFSPDSKELFLISNRTLSAYPRGAIANLYSLELIKKRPELKRDKMDALFATDIKNEVIDLSWYPDLDQIYKRFKPVMRIGAQNNPFIFKQSGKWYLIFNSNHEGVWGVYHKEIDKWDDKPAIRFKGVESVMNISSNSTALYGSNRKGIYKLDIASAAATRISINNEFSKNIINEFYQMFNEVWTLMDENFYDVNFHGVDWKEIRSYYYNYLGKVKTRSQLRTLINDMLNELNASHLGFSSYGVEESRSTIFYSFNTGIIFNNNNPYIVDGVLSGSTTDYSGSPIKKGDRLVAVDGVEIDSLYNRNRYFYRAIAPKEVEMIFLRDGKYFSTIFKTQRTAQLKEQLYDRWEEYNRDYVEQVAKGKVAYVHMRDMSSNSLEKFLIEMNSYAVHREGLILDLRFNNGGNVHQEVIDFLRRKSHFKWSYRDAEKVTHPNYNPSDYPIVVLVNERSLSDAEVTSNGIKELGIAKIIGTETYRWIIFTSGALLVDGSTLRLPSWGCYTLDGKNLEKTGVEPDIYVKNNFYHRIISKDPQLDRALKELLTL